MKLLLAICALSIAVGLYVIWVRPWLKTKSWAQGFFALIEPIEIALWKKSETILWARLKMLVGVMLVVLTSIGSIDLTPLMPFVPDQYEPLVRMVFNLLPLTITMVGLIDEKLRKETTTPLEIVALSEEQKQAPAVQQVVAQAEAAKVEAVAVVAEAKAEGTV